MTVSSSKSLRKGASRFTGGSSNAGPGHGPNPLVRQLRTIWNIERSSSFCAAGQARHWPPFQVIAFAIVAFSSSQQSSTRGVFGSYTFRQRTGMDPDERRIPNDVPGCGRSCFGVMGRMP